MAKDINKETYDEATLAKLDIFEQYLIAWLPVFIHTPYTGEVMICDFFAGSGQDIECVPGSPLRILRTIENYREQISQKNITINVILNEFIPDKFAELQRAVSENFDPQSWGQKVNVSCQNKDFQVLFCELYAQLKGQPNLLFIDQNGLKHVNHDIFQKLIELDKTDLLFFISSSYMKRFIDNPEFKIHFDDLDSEKIKNARYEDIHRMMFDYYKTKIPSDNKTKLYPYTLKKERGSNIYGLIFGSKHLLGVEKFLDLAWDKNKINGEANFDIDKDIDKSQLGLFDNLPGHERQKTKKEIYETNLEDFIITQGGVTNLDILKFTFEMGHPKAHARECVMKFRNARKIECDAQIGFSYNACIKNRNIKEIKVKEDG